MLGASGLGSLGSGSRVSGLGSLGLGLNSGLGLNQGLRLGVLGLGGTVRDLG